MFHVAPLVGVGATAYRNVSLWLPYLLEHFFITVHTGVRHSAPPSPTTHANSIRSGTIPWN